MLAYAELVAVANIDTLFGDIHPGAVFAAEILNIETFEPIVLELGVL